MASYPNMQTGIALNHQQNQAANIASQMSLAQASLNTAQYMTAMPYLQQGKWLNFLMAQRSLCVTKYTFEQRNARRCF